MPPPPASLRVNYHTDQLYTVLRWLCTIQSSAWQSLPSLLDRSLTSPARQVSVTSEMLDAHRPMACMVAATNCLSELVM